MMLYGTCHPVTTRLRAALAAKAATATIPIVFTTSSDPVQIGFVASMSRPEGNLTGASQLNVEVAPKRLELMQEAIPTASAVALLVNPTSPVAETVSRDLQAASTVRGLKLHVLHAGSDRDFAAVFSSLCEIGE